MGDCNFVYKNGNRYLRRSESETDLKNIESRIKTLGDKLESIVKEHGSAIGLPNEYYNTRKEYQDLQKKRSKMLSEMSKNKKSTTTDEKRTFVNAFGEATTREITSSTYERAMKRQDKEILRMLGL